MAGPKLHITHVFLPARVGGLERVVEMLATGHAARGHSVSALAVLPGDVPAPPLLDRLASQQVAVDVVRVSGRAYADERRRLAAALTARGGSGIVHTHGYRADVLHAPVAARLGFSTVTTLHGFTGGGLKNRLYEYLQVKAVSRIGRVVAVSRPLAERVRRSGVDESRLRVIPNAFTISDDLIPRAEARRELGIDTDAFLAGWVGRMSHEKGADVLVDALAHLKDARLIVAFVGDGPELARVRARADALGVADAIRWLGPIDGAGKLFRGFDALVLSSRTEGTPIVLFEAMAAEVPIVATAVGGVPDVLSSDDALLVPSESPEALAAAIRRVIAAPAEAEGRARHARRVLTDRFAPEPWLTRYEAVYAEALGLRN